MFAFWKNILKNSCINGAESLENPGYDVDSICPNSKACDSTMQAYEVRLGSSI